MIPATHAHEWNTEGACRVHFDVGRRLVRCHARRCAAPDCGVKAIAPFRHCRDHKALGQQLAVQPSA